MAFVDSNRTIVVITGVNTGIGFETAKALLQSSCRYHVFLGSRFPEKGEKAAEALKKEIPIPQAFEKVKTEADHIDVLVNNAGAAYENALRRGELTVRQAWLQAYDTNVAGAQVMTQTFAPLLIRSKDAHLIFLTSGLSSLENMSKSYRPGPVPSPSLWPKDAVYSPNAYRSSKAALNMMMLSWHWELQPDGVKVWCVSPGFLATNLGGDQKALKDRGAGDPSIGGRLVASVVEGARDAEVGKVVAGSGVQPF